MLPSVLYIIPSFVHKAEGKKGSGEKGQIEEKGMKGRWLFQRDVCTEGKWSTKENEGLTGSWGALGLEKALRNGKEKKRYRKGRKLNPKQVDR